MKYMRPQKVTTLPHSSFHPLNDRPVVACSLQRFPFACQQGQVVARPMMYLALTYDHRLIDGREAVTFLKSVALKVQDPTRLLLDL